jgi:hypothetical protein
MRQQLRQQQFSRFRQQTDPDRFLEFPVEVCVVTQRTEGAQGRI